MRELREPEAVTIVQHGRLRMGVERFTRGHDRAQILDNAKHVLFSTRTFEIPSDGGISFSVEMHGEGRNCIPGDLYDGFASFLCLDFSTGTAIDLFVRDALCAAVFARLPFPGIEVPDLQPMKYWAIFDEKVLEHPGPQAFTIEVVPARSEIRWLAGEALLRKQALPDYMLGPLLLGFGLMTEKDIGSNGSVSCHGQGVDATWGPVRIRQWTGPQPEPVG